MDLRNTIGTRELQKDGAGQTHPRLELKRGSETDCHR